MNTLKSRLEAALRQREGATKAGLARACGVSKPAVSAWFSGAAQAMGGDRLLAAARYLGVRPDWLASGRGPMSDLTAGSNIPATGDDAPLNDTILANSKQKTRKLPLLRWEYVGRLGNVQMDSNGAIGYMETPFEASEGSYLLELSGEAMSPDYRHGEIIQIDPMASPRHGDDVVVVLPNDRVIFRRLMNSEDGQHLQAANPAWPDRLQAMPAGARIAGVVIGSWMRRRS